jgi:nicotinamidase-related amidase
MSNSTNENANSKNTTEKVLVIVDVQNGFIKGGSFGYHNQELQNLELSIQQTRQIDKLIDENNTIIFTRDFHPINHLSIGVKNKVTINHATTWPSHCLNTNSFCQRNHNESTNKKIKNTTNYGVENPGNLKNRTFITIGEYLTKYKNKNVVSSLQFPEEYLVQQIKGTYISFLMYMTKYAPEILSLLLENSPIGLPIETSKNQNPNFALINQNPFIVSNEGKTFVQLVKGQLCRYESYSAFNYHLKLKLARTLAEGQALANGTLTAKGILNNKLAQYSSEYITKQFMTNANKNPQDLSTGLFEYILKSPKKNIEITVCGLVGDVCVINSVTEGLILWNNLYENGGKQVIFNYSLAGTLFAGPVAPFGFTSENPTIEIFYEEMCAYLNKWMTILSKDEFKKFVQFNVLDYNGNHDGVIFFNENRFMYVRGSNKKVMFGGKKPTKKLVKKLVKKVKSTKK